MNAHQDKAKTIFLNAVDITSETERLDYLKNQCGEDTKLRSEIDELLRHQLELTNFLESPSPDIAATALHSATKEKVGTLVGPYKIREQLAEGGMGVVYVADQAEPVRRRVALKVIKPGMATKDVVARFEAERQALAMMDHPHIAHIFDGGVTESGQPFFAMELVKGLPITQYCDQHKLTSVDRLELFSKVCKAVQHAHQKGVIHRDIKPSNVLIAEIDGAAVPKIIDFGVAKAVSQKLTDQTIYTQFSQMVGTPLYMSPEQVSMDTLDIDTRSDVYSLGVLLYELLTGKTPFDREILKESGFDEFRRIIREDEPQRPSAAVSTLQAQALSTVAENHHIDPRKLCSELRGELDWIVMRALEKDRNRRYESASSFAADIERYLEDEPVEACPPSKAYQLQKFTKRNKAFLTTAAIVLIALVTGTGIASWQAVVANEERGQARLAEEKAKESEAVALKAKKKAIANVNRAVAANKRAEKYMQTAFDALDKLYQVALGEDRLVGENGEVWHNEAYIPLTVHESELLEATLELYAHLAQSRSENPDAMFRNASAFKNIGLLYRSQRVDDKADEAFEQATKILEHLTADSIGTAQQYKSLGVIYHCLAASPNLIHDRETYTTKAENANNRYYELDPNGIDALLFEATERCRLGDFEIAQAIIKKAVRIHSNDGDVYQRAAGIVWRNGREDLAVPYARESVRIDPDNDRSLDALGFFLMLSGELEEAHQLLLKLTKRSPLNYRGFKNLSEIYRRKGKYEKALEAAEKTVELNPVNHFSYVTRAAAYIACGDFEKGLHDYERAQELSPLIKTGIPKSILKHLSAAVQGKNGTAKAEKAIEFLIFKISEDPLNGFEDDPDQASQFNAYCCIYGNYLENIERTEEAEKMYRKGIAILEKLKTDVPIEDYYRSQNVEVYYRLIELLKSTNRSEEAKQLFHSMEDPRTADAYLQRAKFFARQKQYDKALPDFDKYVELSPNSSVAHFERGEFHLTVLKNYQEALNDFDRALEIKNMNAGAYRFKRRGLAHFHLGHYQEALADMAEALSRSPDDSSALSWIPPELVAKCPDQAFRQGMLKLADSAVENAEEKDKPDMRTSRARLLIAFGKWDKAREDFEATLTAEDVGYYALYQVALLSLTEVDLPRYQELCQEMLTAFAESDEPTATHFTAWTCALAPNSLEDYAPAIKLARHAVGKDPDNKQYLDGLGAILMRSGQYDAAKIELDKALAAGESDNTSSSYIRYFLAMTEHHLGHQQVAQDQLLVANNAAAKELKDTDQPPAWNRKLTLELLRKEAEALINQAKTEMEPTPPEN